MGDGRDELERRGPRQLGVRVERDDVADAREELLWRRHHAERRRGPAAEQAIELFELATLALPPHKAPRAMRFAPACGAGWM